MKLIKVKLCIADDIKRIHRKISTYVYTVMAVAPQILPMLSPDVRDAMPLWLKTGISVIAVGGVMNNLVKVKKVPNAGTSES